MDTSDAVSEPPSPVRRLRLVIAAEDYEAALAFEVDDAHRGFACREFCKLEGCSDPPPPR